MAKLICPVCGRVLERGDTAYRCENGHSFDIARSGYVNLLRSTASGKRHGDDKRMVRARTTFLDGGFYDPLSELLCRCIVSRSPQQPCLLDAGCGEGKYTADAVLSLTESGKRVDAVGIDISRDALIAAARRCPALQLAAASSAALPLADGSVDLLLNIFSPLERAEFHRVLAPGGTLFRVVPMEKHLWELKKLIYETPYENPPVTPELEGFRLLRREELRYRITLHSGEKIMALFQMTPYYYKTGAADQQKAAEAGALETAVEFAVLLYEKC